MREETHRLSHVSETSNLVWKSVSPLTVGARGKLFFRAEFDVEYRWRVTYFVSKVSRYIYIYPQKERKKKTNLFRGPIKMIYHEGVSNMIAD